MSDTAALAAATTRSRRSLLRAAGWCFAMDGGQQIINLIVAFVLAGLLGPRAYGVVAMAWVFVLFLEVLQRQGIASAVVQRKVLEREHADTAFWLVLAATTATLGACLLLAPWWARVNGLPELTDVIRVLSVVLVLHGLASVQEALLRRRLRFRVLAARAVAASLVGGLTGVAAALAGAGVWAVVAQQLTTAAVSLVVLWSASGWLPGLRVSGHAAKDLIHFSAGSFLASIAVFVQNRADVLLIGIFFGPYVVGVYQLGSRLVETLVSALSRPVQSLALPELSPHQADPDDFGQRLCRLMRMTAVTALPALGLLAGFGSVLPSLLSDEWAALGSVVPILCVAGAIRVVIALDGPLLQALGRTYALASLTWVSALASASTFTVVGVLLTDAGPGEQVTGVAASRACLYGSMVILLHLWLMRRYTVLSRRTAVRVVARPLALGVVGAVVPASSLAVTNTLEASTWSSLVVSAATTSAAMAWAAHLLMPRLIKVLLRRGRRDASEAEPLHTASVTEQRSAPVVVVNR